MIKYYNHRSFIRNHLCYLLTNDLLSVLILDPTEDTHLFGSRYCTGGYIWQIFHKKYGELLRGPHYPQKCPPVFDGQGAPEFLNHQP
jgi:hypothetical protein